MQKSRYFYASVKLTCPAETSTLLILGELEVVATLVAGKCQEDNPLAVILEEWLD